jgi:hypothetical protein
VIAVEILAFIAELSRLTLDDEFVVDIELLDDALLKTGFDPVVLDEGEDGLADCKVVATVLILRALGASTVDVEVDGAQLLVGVPLSTSFSTRPSMASTFSCALG